MLRHLLLIVLHINGFVLKILRSGAPFVFQQLNFLGDHFRVLLVVDGWQILLWFLSLQVGFLFDRGTGGG